MRRPRKMSTGPKPGTMKAGAFDAFRLARERGSLRGDFDAAASDRLYDWLAPGDAPIAWSISGTTDALGRLAIAIELEGTVPLECQRCLAPMTWPVRQRTVALLAKSEAEGDALDADSDEEVLVAAQPLDALALVEDELLLSLPYAPTHAKANARHPNERARAGNPHGVPQLPDESIDKRSTTWLSSRTRNLRRSAACTARTTSSPPRRLPWNR